MDNKLTRSSSSVKMCKGQSWKVYNYHGHAKLYILRFRGSKNLGFEKKARSSLT